MVVMVMMAFAVGVVALLVIMVVMVMLVLVLIVVMVVMVMMAFAVGIVALVLVMVMVVMMVLMLHLAELALQDVFLHDLADLRAAELIPGGGDQAGVFVDALQQFHRGQGLGVVRAVGAAEDDQVGAGHLVVEEFAEVAGVHLALARVHHRDLRADLRAFHALHGVRHVRQLADARGLDQDPVGRVVAHDLRQRLGEVAHQRAADAAGVHLGDLHARVLQERAVHRDLAEFVLDQHELFVLVSFGDQLTDQGRLAGAQKSGKNVDSCQGFCLPYLFFHK